MKRIVIRKILFSFTMLFCSLSVFPQEYNADLNALGQYVQRMYLNEPFEGVRVIEDYDNCFLIVITEEYVTSNDYAGNRKAEVKALSKANEFLNGAHISQNTVVFTHQDSNGYSYDEIEDFIEARSMGYVQTMQMLSTFNNSDGKKVYIYCKKLPMPEKSQGKKGKRKR